MKIGEYIDVHLRDCMEGMKEFPDNHFDLAIVDVPYTDNYASMQRLNQNMKGKVANVGKYHYGSLANARPKNDYWEEMRRVSKNQIIWGANYLVEFVASTPCVIVWDKNNTGNYADCEIAFGSFATGAKIYKYTWNGMLQGDMKNKEHRIHPTQKPVALYKWLLKNYAESGHKILDTHLGSMSIAIACHDYKCHLTGFEIDEDYFEAGRKRVQNHVSQLQLF